MAERRHWVYCRRSLAGRCPELVTLDATKICQRAMFNYDQHIRALHEAESTSGSDASASKPFEAKVAALQIT
jgi:hypothetical protein